MPVLLALILASCGALPSSSPDSTPDPQKQTQPSEQHASPDPRVNKQETEANQRPPEKEKGEGDNSRLVKFADRYGNLINAASTAIMAIFTVALFISTHMLWKSGEKHAERELRAHVFIDKFDIEATATIPFRVTTKVKNFGQTPAYSFRIDCRLDLQSETRSEFPSKPLNPKHSVVTLAPGDVQQVAREVETWTDDEFSKLMDGTIRAFLYGKITYRDAFGKDRFTNFRYKSTPLRQFGDEWRIFLNATREGNDCDEEKKKRAWFLRWLPS